MGLDCSHNAFHGAYGAFNRLRQEVCRAMGGSFPPHWKYNESGDIEIDDGGLATRNTELEDGFWYSGDGYDEESHPGLYEFLKHSDCDGEISPEMCAKVADELEAILPKVESLNSKAYGHIAASGGYSSTLKQFIAGCRAAALAGEPLKFY